MEVDEYRCANCGASVPVHNRSMHEIRWGPSMENDAWEIWGDPGWQNYQCTLNEVPAYSGHICEFCGESFTNEQEHQAQCIVLQMMIGETPRQVQIFTCTICGERVREQERLIHMNGHRHENQMAGRGHNTGSQRRSEEHKNRNRRHQANAVRNDNAQRPQRSRIPQNEVEALMMEYQAIENDQMGRIQSQLENQIRQIAAAQHGRHGQRVRRVVVEQERPQRQMFEAGDGLSHNQISEYPTEVLDRDTGLAWCICMETMDQGHTVKTLPCLHRFHERCIDNWICRSSTCPIDKQPLR